MAASGDSVFSWAGRCGRARGLSVTSLSDLRVARRRLHATVALSLTERCTARCRHCSVRAAPNGKPAADASRVGRWIHSVAEVPSLEMIAITGGEPFLEEGALHGALAAAEASELRTVVFTNAYWAETQNVARGTLARFPHIDLLEISADVFHEEFVPLSNLRHAAEAALARGMGVWFQMNEFQGDAFGTRLRDVLGPEIVDAADFTHSPLLDVGRARDLGLSGAARRGAEFPSGRCNLLTSPIIRPDGSVLACCNEQVYGETEGHVLHLGSLERTSFLEMVRVVQSDPLLEAFRTFGPAHVAQMAAKIGWSPGLYREGNICDLCRDLLADPAIVSKLRRGLSEPDQKRLVRLATEYLEARSEVDESGALSP